MKGYVDLHTHGLGKYDTQTTNPSDILKIAALHGKAGTDAICLAIYPGPLGTMRQQIDAVRTAIEKQKEDSGFRRMTEKNEAAQAMVLGVHVEGPFLNSKYSGALDNKALLKPSLALLKELVSGNEDIIKIITIAPELTGALKVIERCAELGIRVNMGHSDATYAQALEGKKAGATGITHFFNAMRPFHHREPGLAGLGLLDEEVYIEVIADGAHLHPRTLEMIFNRKRLDRIMLVTDSVKGRITRSNKYNVSAIFNEQGVLAGSGITLADSAPLLSELGIPDAEIAEAAADNPARYIGLGSC
ncbi:MAG: amidohydrolase family protein [Thermodesulfovibrionales bacterium]